jgi:hypothetical protein
MMSLPTHHSLLQLKKKNKIITKTQIRTTSRKACHRPLQPKKKNLDVGFSCVARDDDEPFDLSLSFSFFSSLVEDDDETRGLSLFLTFFLHL